MYTFIISGTKNRIDFEPPRQWLLALQDKLILRSQSATFTGIPLQRSYPGYFIFHDHRWLCSLTTSGDDLVFHRMHFAEEVQTTISLLVPAMTNNSNVVKTAELFCPILDIFSMFGVLPIRSSHWLATGSYPLLVSAKWKAGCVCLLSR